MKDIKKYIAICERAEKQLGKELLNNTYGSRISRMMDIESADMEFHLRLDELLKADDEDFYHDVLGIWRESDRTEFPCTFGFFVPRYANI